MSKLKTLGIAYLVSVNAGAFGLFWYDKQQAIQHKWRIPEKTLHTTALIGGWLGGIAAMNQFRHKTSKKSFYTVYYSCALLNGALLASLVSPQTRTTALHLLQNILKRR